MMINVNYVVNDRHVLWALFECMVTTQWNTIPFPYMKNSNLSHGPNIIYEKLHVICNNAIERIFEYLIYMF